MNSEFVLVKVGSGSASHFGVEIFRDGKAIGVSISCGSRVQGTSKRIVGSTNLQDYPYNANRCEKCARRVLGLAA